MAWFAVNKDGSESVFQNKPKRCFNEILNLPNEYFCGINHNGFDNVILTWKDDTLVEDNFYIFDIYGRKEVKTIRLNKYNDFRYWDDCVMDDNYDQISYYTNIRLPKGSIEKLTGHKMSWEDEPLEIKTT